MSILKFVTFISLLGVLSPFFTSAALFEFDVASEMILVGDTSHIFTYINPEDDRSASIAGIHFLFPKGLLWAKSFTLASGWIQAPGKEYNSINNARGEIKATAGLEGGVSARTLFGIIEFIAVGDGVAEMAADGDSFIFDAGNNNLMRGAGKAYIKIEKRHDETMLPSQLFDINFELGKNVFQQSDVISARVMFDSFGRVPTPVDMTFTIVDAKNREVARSSDSVIVETTTLFTKNFDNLKLSPGRYALHLHTRYGAGVEDDFSYSFVVIAPARGEYEYPGIIAFLIIVLFALLTLFKKTGSKT